MGLRTYIVGHAIDDAVKRLSERPDLDIVRVDDADAIVARVDGSEPAIVILPVRDVDEELATIAALVSNGAQVIVLASTENPGLRVAAFSAGVSDVIFPPYQDWFVEETVMALAGNPLRKDVRVPAQMEALLVPIGVGAALGGNLVSLSMGEFRARVSGSLPPGAVLRVALKPPRPHRLPVLFARATRAEALEDGRLEVRARFAGMTAEEQLLLGKYLEQQPAEVEDLASVLAAIEQLDVAGLRNAAGKSLGGLALPPMTELELAWLRAAPNTADAALADVALARIRAELAASVLEAVGADLVGLSGLPLGRYREDLVAAHAQVDAALLLFRRDEARQTALRALASRLEDAARLLARIAEQINDATVPNLSRLMPPAGPTKEILGAAVATAAPAAPTRDAPPTAPVFMPFPLPRAAVPAFAPAPATTPVGGDSDLLVDLDDSSAIDETGRGAAVGAAAEPVRARAAGSSLKRATIPPLPGAIPAPDDFANAPTNPQIPAPDLKTPPAMLNPDAPRPPTMIPPPPPPAAAPAGPGVASPRTSNRRRNPFLEE